MVNGSKNFKRSMVFITTAYLAFATFFADNSPFSRTLQEGGETSALVPAAPTDEKDPVDILVILMGEAVTFPRWKGLMGNIDASIDLLFGSFDDELPPDSCENEDGLDCQTLFIPGTGWTSGRNRLGEEALRKERKRGKKYDYWLFMDDDVNVVCVGGQPMEDILGPGHCWQKVFNFISSDQVPENASVVGIPYGGKGEFGYSGFSTTDAFFAAFKRDRISHILPYPTIDEGFSEWVSQAALFCIMRTCHKSSVVLVPYVVGRNGAHREYNRGLNMGQIYKTIVDSYHDEEAGFQPCKELTVDDVFQGKDHSGLFETSEDLNNAIPPPDLETCAPLKNRYDAWESQVTLD